MFLCVIWLWYSYQFQYSQLPGKTCLRNDLLCVALDVRTLSLSCTCIIHVIHCSINCANALLNGKESANRPVTMQACTYIWHIVSLLHG